MQLEMRYHHGGLALLVQPLRHFGEMVPQLAQCLGACGAQGGHLHFQGAQGQGGFFQIFQQFFPAFLGVPRLGQALAGGRDFLLQLLPSGWLAGIGPLGFLPLPVKYRLHFGEPLYLEGDPLDEDAAIHKQVDRVRDQIALLLEEGLAQRRGWFA